MVSEARERHPSLSAWLVLLALSNGFSALIYGFMWITLVLIKSSAESTSKISSALPTLAVTSIFALIFIYALYKWKKWGLFGFAATTLVTFAMYMKMGMNNLIAIMALIGITVLVYLIRPYWNQMDTF